MEKPISAEDHNIIIYFPSAAGGGCQKLFRKIGNKSSKYCKEQNCVRRDGSYIYEDFQPTDGTDVKIYTVGPEYAHAEARKSPALDGKVERDKEGKEVRYPVILNAQEKHIAMQVCLAFKQTICGFDLLRANGQSYVCDVNGFSFVKNSQKYYDDSAKVLGNMIKQQLGKPFDDQPLLFDHHHSHSLGSHGHGHEGSHGHLDSHLDSANFVPTTKGTMMELRCVVAVIRHGDRTPKQKMKMEVNHFDWFELFRKYDGFKTGKLKLKKPKQLQKVLDVARNLLFLVKSEVDSENLDLHDHPELETYIHKLDQMKTVLEMYGHFSGINRKVQFKLQLPKDRKSFSSPSIAGHKDKNLSTERPTPGPEDNPPQDYSNMSLLIILKWGGELTHSGKHQAEQLGKAFRCMYPGGHGDYAGFPGCGLLRLHSTYRHDLKIYASDEGRVQMTAAAFAKGLLALEGELPPILVQMVKSANTNGLLDDESEQLGSYQNR